LRQFCLQQRCQRRRREAIGKSIAAGSRLAEAERVELFQRSPNSGAAA
jgi:hypothetical protein